MLPLDSSPPAAGSHAVLLGMLQEPSPTHAHPSPTSSHNAALDGSLDDSFQLLDPSSPSYNKRFNMAPTSIRPPEKNYYTLTYSPHVPSPQGSSKGTTPEATPDTIIHVSPGDCPQTTAHHEPSRMGKIFKERTKTWLSGDPTTSASPATGFAPIEEVHSSLEHSPGPEPLTSTSPPVPRATSSPVLPNVADLLADAPVDMPIPAASTPNPERGDLGSFMDFLDSIDEDDLKLLRNMGRNSIDVLVYKDYEFRRERTSDKTKYTQTWVCRHPNTKKSKSKCKSRFKLMVKDLDNITEDAIVGKFVEHNHPPCQIYSYNLTNEQILSDWGTDSEANDTTGSTSEGNHANGNSDEVAVTQESTSELFQPPATSASTPQASCLPKVEIETLVIDPANFYSPLQRD